MAGFSETTSIWLAAVTAAAQSVGVCLGICFIEKCGRRQLVLTSLGMVVASLVCLGTGFSLYEKYEADDDQSSSSSTYAWVIVAAMMTYLLTFGVGMSSVPWTVNAEIYPNHARSLGTSASTTVNWIGNVVVSATFLSLASDNALGKDGAFFLYASIGVAGWIWLCGCMPETKGLSLEEIELLFAREGDPVRPGERGADSPTHPAVAMSGAAGGPRGFAVLRDNGSTNGSSGEGGTPRGGDAPSWAGTSNTGGSAAMT